MQLTRGAGSVRRRKREDHYGARFGAVARRGYYIGWSPGGSLGGASGRNRSAGPESPSTGSEPAARSAATSTSSANDPISWSGSDTASAPIAAAKSSAVSEGRRVTFKRYVKSTMKLSYWEMVAVG